MADLWVVLTLLAFFGLCVALVTAVTCSSVPTRTPTWTRSPADEAAELAAEVGVR